MGEIVCCSCGDLCERSVRHKNHCYCPKPGCQQARQAAWKRYKMRTDPDYRLNQRLSCQTWAKAHPGYWSAYRVDTGHAMARLEFSTDLSELTADQRSLIDARVAKLLKENRYDPASGQLKVIDAEKVSYQRQRMVWTEYFLQPTTNAGLPSKYIRDPEEIRQLTAFFAWTAWASVVKRPEKPYSYTNNFPFDPMVGNLLTADALLWSALSVAMLLAGLALVWFTFDRFDYLGWKGESRNIHPHMLPGGPPPARKRPLSILLV